MDFRMHGATIKKYITYSDVLQIINHNPPLLSLLCYCILMCTNIGYDSVSSKTISSRCAVQCVCVCVCVCVCWPDGVILGLLDKAGITRAAYMWCQ
jgi:hypothetical protein